MSYGGCSVGEDYTDLLQEGEINGIKIKGLNGKIVIYTLEAEFKNQDGSDYKNNDSFVNDVKKSFEYLKHSETASTALQNAVKYGTLTIKSAPNSYHNIYDKNIIRWASRSGVNNHKPGTKSERTGKNSPALQLIHEIGHYINDMEDQTARNKRYDNKSYRWTNEEEKFTIEKYDQIISKELNNSILKGNKFQEDIRQEHGALAIPFSSPTPFP